MSLLVNRSSEHGTQMMRLSWFVVGAIARLGTGIHILAQSRRAGGVGVAEQQTSTELTVAVDSFKSDMEADN